MQEESTPYNPLDGVSEVIREEIELIQSMYLDQFHWLDHFNHSLHSSSNINRSQDLLFQLRMNGVFKDLSEHLLQIRVAIPAGYPTTSIPNLTVNVNSISREDELNLNKKYKFWLNSSSDQTDCPPPPKGEICIDILVNKVLELVSEFSPIINNNIHNNDKIQSIDDSVVPIPDHLDMAWSVFWMHHIKATTKRKSIVAWGRELEVRGWSKPGYPGALIIDGRKESVREYTNRIKSMRWKAIQQRHFEEYSVPFNLNFFSSQVENHRKIKKIVNNNNNNQNWNQNENQNQNDGVIEVESMSALLSRAQSSGLDNQVMQILKIK